MSYQVAVSGVLVRVEGDLVLAVRPLAALRVRALFGFKRFKHSNVRRSEMFRTFVSHVQHIIHSLPVCLRIRGLCWWTYAVALLVALLGGLLVLVALVRVRVRVLS